MPRYVEEEDRRRLGALGERRRHRGDPGGEPRAHREAVARALDGGREHAWQRQPPVGGMRLEPAVDRAGHGHGRGQHPSIRHRREPARLERGNGRPGGRAAAAVEEAHATCARRVHQPERVAPDARHVRVDHAQHRGRRDAGVHRRAAGAKHRHARGGREHMRAGHHAARGHRGRPRGRHVLHVAGGYRARSIQRLARVLPL
jgi:hypothetical protein